jgi:hypothetical protein
MLPEVLTSADPEHERRRYKLVRLDTLEDVPGLILSASTKTGQCLVQQDGVSRELQFGPDGVRIIGA